MGGAFPFLWLSGGAVDAAQFYASVFPECTWEVAMQGQEGDLYSVVMVRLKGAEFALFNGGEAYTLNPAVSLMVTCETQAEIDQIWAGLMEGGTPMACGWITDKFGVTWQVTPRQMFDLYRVGSPAQKAALMATMQTMVKFEIAPLDAAFAAAASGE